MLLRFEVENFRSIREPVELSMIALDVERAEVRRPLPHQPSVVPVAGIFGPNASGKSNVLNALVWLRDAVAHSLRRWDRSIPVEPFAFGEWPGRDTSFVLDLAVGGTRFEYLVDLNQSRVAYEALFHYPEGRRRRVFEREGNELVLQRGLGRLAGTRSLLTDRSLALTIMRRFEEQETTAFTQAMLNMSVLGRRPGVRAWVPGGGRSATTRIFDLADDGQTVSPARPVGALRSEAADLRQRALSLLKLADLGVSDVEIEERQVDMGDGEVFVDRRARLVHDASDERLSFDFRDESDGTKAWFELVGPMIRALDTGALIIVDELDASLHPTLSAQLVRLFQSRVSNPHEAQLVFTSHDTSLLERLNRDEVWLTQKRADGATDFGALSDFAGARVRKSERLESGYRSGRFGGLPDVNQPEVLRSLGLIG